jgi:hypothetical protein
MHPLDSHSLHTNYTFISPMLHNKRTTKKRQIQRGYRLLTNAELAKIRSFLPQNWRQKIHENNAGISLRQITEVFNQRTKNLDHNKIVWGAINEVLRNAGQEKLVERVDKCISFCSALYNIIQD